MLHGFEDASQAVTTAPEMVQPTAQMVGQIWVCSELDVRPYQLSEQSLAIQHNDCQKASQVQAWHFNNICEFVQDFTGH